MGIQLIEPNINDADKAMVQDALESGWINMQGAYIDRFEDKFAKTVAAKEAVAVASGTAGLFLALKVLGIKPGDHVLVPTITFAATINAVCHTGAIPVFMDCDEYLNISVDEVEKYLYDCYLPPKAIIPVHVFGNPCDMQQLNKISHKYDLKTVEDACEAIGSISNAGTCGSCADLSVFSFSFNKMITCGNGGMVTSDKEEYINKIKYLATQAKDDPINYIHNEIGYNLGLSNILAALGYSQLQRLDQFLAAKKRIFDRYYEHLGDNLYNKPPYGIVNNNWLIGYKTNKVTEIAQALKEHDIQTRPLWRPNHLQKEFSKIGVLSKPRLLDSERLYKRTINLPCSTTLKDTQIDEICKIILEV